MSSLLTISNFPRAILHIDGDAFFASCEQIRDPKLKGQPVVTGKERGIVASMSYEAKALGITRAMKLYDIQRKFPQVIILPSDYETYSLLSQKFYNIVRRYTPDVEEYGIDECFADITGLRRQFHCSYGEIAEKIQNNLAKELGFTFSVGLAPNKVIAKLGSKWKKPSGLTVIPGKKIHLYLDPIPVEKIWGIGPQTTAYLAKFRIKTALQFARLSENWITNHLTKPHYEIWQELSGKFVLPLNLIEKTSYASIQKVKTFTPPSRDRNFVFAQLSKNVENACIKARRYKLATCNIAFFLKTQEFNFAGLEVKLSRPSAFPNEIIEVINPVFDAVYRPGVLYRQTGITLLKLEEDKISQPDLFGGHVRIEKMRSLYKSVDQIKSKYGKHTLYLGSSFQAHKFGAHLGKRGDVPKRMTDLFNGESRRKRLGIPMFIGEVQ